MPEDTTANERAPSPVAARELPGAAPEAEVFGALGALLGMLEVIATDDSALSPTQVERLRTALGLGHRLQQYVEALLTLAASDLDSRLRRSERALRPLVEHAVRGALRAFDAHDVTLRWPTRPDWGAERVLVDVSRLDRSLGALVGVLANNLERTGTIEISVERKGAAVWLGLRGEPRGEGPKKLAPPESGLIERACERLLELHGGRLVATGSRLAFELMLPMAEVTP